MLRGHHKAVYDVAFSPDGRWLVTASEDGTVHVQPFVDWDRMEYLRLIDFELPGLLLPAGGAD